MPWDAHITVHACRKCPHAIKAGCRQADGRYAIDSAEISLDSKEFDDTCKDDNDGKDQPAGKEFDQKKSNLQKYAENNSVGGPSHMCCLANQRSGVSFGLFFFPYDISA